MPAPSQAQIELDPRPERLLDITMCGHPAQSTGVVNLFLLLGNRHYQLVERVHGSRNDRTSGASGGNRDGCFYRPCTRLPFPEGCFHVTEHGDYWIAAAAPDAAEGGALAPVTENTPLPPPEALTTSGRTEKDKKKEEAEDVVSVEEQSVHSQVASSSSSSSQSSHGADAELHLEKPKKRKRKHGDEEIKKSRDRASQEKDTKRASADASDAKATEREDREASGKHRREKEKKKEKHKHRDDKEEEKRRRKEKKKAKKAEKKARKEEKKRRKAEKALRAAAAAVDAVETGKPAAATHSTARNETQDGARATTPETQPAFQEIVLGIEEDTALAGPAPASPKASPSPPLDAVGKPPASKAAPAVVEPPQKTTALQAAGNAKRRPRLPSPTTSSSSTASSSPTSTAPPPPRQQQQQQPQQPPFRKQRSETSAQNTPRHSGAAMAPEDKVRSWQTTPVMPLSPALDASMAAAKQPSQPTSRAPSGTTPRTGPAPPTPAQKGRDGKPRNTSDGPSRSRPASTKVTPQHAPSTPQQPHSYAAYGPPPSPPLESPALGFTPVMNSLTEEFSLEPSEASSYVGSDYMYDD